jgi:hypothetical protein
MATCFWMVFYCLCVHWHIFCWFVYRCYPQINSVLSQQTRCSIEEPPLELTEDCCVPPHLSQSVSCKWLPLHYVTAPGSVHTDFNQKGWFLLECKAIWALWCMVASSQVLWSPTSLALNANHLASCKTQKYTASSIWMYIKIYPYMYMTFRFLYIYIKNVNHSSNRWLCLISNSVSCDGLPPSWPCMPIISDIMTQSHTWMCMQIMLWLLYWLGTCVNFIPNSEGSLALFLSVVCPTFFCNQ